MLVVVAVPGDEPAPKQVAFARDLEAAGVRLLMFAGDLERESDRDALREMTAELLDPRS